MEVNLKKPAPPVHWFRFALLGVGIGLLIVCAWVGWTRQLPWAETGKVAPAVYTSHVHHYEAGLSVAERARVERVERLAEKYSMFKDD